jgi:outer membrane lipoprotein SlyB
MAEKKNVKQVVDKAISTLTKEVPEAVKENKGAAIGAVLGYFLADAVSKNEGLITAVLGGLVGHAIDEKKKKDVF